CNAPGERNLHRSHHVLIRGFAACGADLAIANLHLIFGGNVHDRNRSAARIQRICVQEARTDQLVGSLEQVEIADHRTRGAQLRRYLLKSVDNDLRPDAGGTAEGEAEGGMKRGHAEISLLVVVNYSAEVCLKVKSEGRRVKSEEKFRSPASGVLQAMVFLRT